MYKKTAILSLLAAVAICPAFADNPAGTNTGTAALGKPGEGASTSGTSASGTTGAKTTESGLKYTDIKEGNGQIPKEGQIVIVHYTGTLDDGTKFDSSRGKDPFKFTLGQGQVIKGWDEGISTMKVGGQRTLTIPPELGYAAQGAGTQIPANATLHFDVELIGVEGKGNEGYSKATKS
jgi:peptidylprolyl isomerase